MLFILVLYPPVCMITVVLPLSAGRIIYTGLLQCFQSHYGKGCILKIWISSVFLLSLVWFHCCPVYHVWYGRFYVAFLYRGLGRCNSEVEILSQGVLAIAVQWKMCLVTAFRSLLCGGCCCVSAWNLLMCECFVLSCDLSLKILSSVVNMMFQNPSSELTHRYILLTDICNIKNELNTLKESLKKTDVPLAKFIMHSTARNSR